MTPKGSQQLTVANSAIGLTVPGPSSGIPGANYAIIKVNTAQVRWKDGNDPTTTAGIALDPGDIMRYSGNLGTVKFIRTGSTSAVLDIEYYRID